MAFIDLVLAVFVGAFVIFGLFFGLIHTLGSLVGTLVGIVVATRLIDPVAQMFSFLGTQTAIGNIVLFIILFLLVTRLVGLVFWMLDKIFGFVKMIPFAKTIDKILGGVFGFVEGVIVVGVICYYAMQILPQDTLLTWLESSAVGNYLIGVVGAFQILFPESLRIVMQFIA